MQFPYAHCSLLQVVLGCGLNGYLNTLRNRVFEALGIRKNVWKRNFEWKCCTLALFHIYFFWVGWGVRVWLCDGVWGWKLFFVQIDIRFPCLKGKEGTPGRTFAPLKFWNLHTAPMNERYCIIHDYWNSRLCMSGKGSLFTIWYLLYHCRVSFWTGVFWLFLRFFSISKVPSNIFMWLAQGDVSLTNIINSHPAREWRYTSGKSGAPHLPCLDKVWHQEILKIIGKM